MAAIILAAKIWEELAVWNVDFKKVFPLVEVEDFALMEKELLSCLQFTVTLKASVFVHCFCLPFPSFPNLDTPSTIMVFALSHQRSQLTFH